MNRAKLVLNFNPTSQNAQCRCAPDRNSNHVSFTKLIQFANSFEKEEKKERKLLVVIRSLFVYVVGSHSVHDDEILIKSTFY